MLSIHPFVQHQVEAFRSFNKPNSEKTLAEGIWEPIEYYDALAAKDEKPRIKWFKDADICSKGFIDKNSHFERWEGREFTFVAKTTATASEAITHLARKGLALLDCGTALQLSQWLALEKYIGPERFNALLRLPRDEFPPLYLQHGAYILGQLYQEVKIQGEEEVLPGDLCYFKNISKYPERHPIENGIGYNVFAREKFKYMGFGLPVEGISSSEMEPRLFNDYNKEPLDPFTYKSAINAGKVMQPIKDTLTWDQFQKERSQDPTGIQGRLVLKIRRPRFDRLEQLRNASPDQIRQLVKSWS